MDNAPTVLFETDGPVAVLTLNRPDKRNAIDAETTDALRDAVARFEADDGLRVAIITGAGGHFCAGMDLGVFLSGNKEDLLFGEGGFAGFVRTKRNKPVIAAVEGSALAGGFEIMLACDMVVASETGLFGLPEPKVGLVAGGGGAIRLGNRVPRVVANEILLTGRTFDAQDAFRYGLLNKIVGAGEALDAARELARTIAGNAPVAVRTSLQLANATAMMDEDAAWAENNARVRKIAQTADAVEGPTAFVEKRKPVWSGR